MIQINFYAESDNEEFVKAAKEYQEIWDNEGEKIQNSIERVSGLSLKESLINAIIFDGAGHSYPLRLYSYHPYDNKKATIIHELCHRLVVRNQIILKGHQNLDFEKHKLINLILFDIWTDLYGYQFANENVSYESKYSGEDYKKAWDWALSFSREERGKKFKQIKTKYQKMLS